MDEQDEEQEDFDVLEDSNLEKVPFVRYQTDENKKSTQSDRVIPIRFNSKELMLLDECKKLLNVKSEGKAVKIMMVVGHNCIKTTFGSKIMKYLFKKDREKLSDYLEY